MNKETESDLYSQINDRLQVEKYQADLEERDTVIAGLKVEIDKLRAESRLRSRFSVLEGLKREGYRLDPAKFAEKYRDMSEDDFKERVEEIRENYAKVDSDDSFIPTDDPGRNGSTREAEVDPEEIVRYAQENKISDGLEAVRRYRKEKLGK